MKQRLKALSGKHKNNKLLYYSKSFARQALPMKLYQSRLEKRLSTLDNYDEQYIKSRLNYYNKLDCKTVLSESVIHLSDFNVPKKNKTYYFDTYEYSRFFSIDFKMDFRFGDVTSVPEEPAIVKSRPINGNNNNSVVLNLDKVRHFTFLKDKKEFTRKKDMLVGRNAVGQEHRTKFLKMYIDHPLCNIGKINNNGKDPELLRDIMTIDEHLDYKFILCLEGNDVATNLKWVMSSNSLAVMPVPKYETWYMEGTLVPGFHFVEIRDDFSDLEEKMEYYMTHTDEALEIIRNANRYIEHFKDRQREKLLSLLVL
ncbi:MAG TPA: glycosyl transferase family 90, partial [Bacteroidales bacterium]|nr:glycosyl transferase family 90 [Bacteroidales bacterium]